MKRRNLVCLAATCCLMAAPSVMAEEAATSTGPLEITQAYWMEYSGKWSSSEGCLYVKIENVSDAPAYLGDGDFVGYAEDGALVLTDEMWNRHICIAPGEYIYLDCSEYDDALEENDIAKYDVRFDISDYGYETTQIPCEISYDLQDTDSYETSYIYVKITNTTEDVVFEMDYSVALFDTEGNLVYADTFEDNDTGICPGSTVVVRRYIDSDTVEYFESNGIEIGSADAVAYICSEDYSY